MAVGKFIVWDYERFSVGIRAIDMQHKQLVEFTNKLYDSCHQEDWFTDLVFKDVLKSAVDYIQIHFSTEEKLMKFYQFPGYEAHKNEHALFTSKVMDEIRQFNNMNRMSANNFTVFLKKWLFSHISFVDKYLGSFLIGKGLS